MGWSGHIAASRFRYSGHFYDGGRSRPIGPHQKLASMEGAQCRAMADTEYRRVRKPLAQQSIQTRLRSLVHCRGRLIKEEPIGLLDQRSGKGDALLFAGGKLERPMASLAEPFG